MLALADNFVRYTNKNIFLTGKAGTGKTTFLKNLKINSPKRMIVVAPTGVAAINAGGLTIHSFFQLPFGPQIPNTPNYGGYNKFQQISQEKRNIIRSLDLLVIDEISMVRADLLDGIDAVLRRIRRNHLPFGGVQLLMIGDLQQLAPVAKNDEWELLREHYESVYFFSALALKKSDYICVELKHIYRQSDDKFIGILNEIRNNALTQKSIEILNSRFNPDFNPKDEEGYMTLCTHNAQAAAINQKKLDQLPEKSRFFDANITGDFPEHMYPTDQKLELKLGAQIMFIKNDLSGEKQFYNGKIGRLIKIIDDSLVVNCQGDADEILVPRHVWHNTKYEIHPESKEIEEKNIGTFSQFPIKAAWAITIHKSQGLTFEKAIIDSASAFAHGQVYVALSRCKSLEGLVLKSKINPNAVFSDSIIGSYNKFLDENQPDENRFRAEKKLFQQNLILNLFDFKNLKFNIQGLNRRIQENFANAKSIAESLNHAIALIDGNMLGVGQKFQGQVISLFAETESLEESKYLLERISKACGYFLPLLSEVSQAVNDFKFDSDNKVLKKLIKQNIEQIQGELLMKKACLNHCISGFNLAEFLSLKSKSLLETDGSTKSSKNTKNINALLYENLMTWRDAMAKEKNMQTWQILPLRTAREIANQLPKTKQSLKEIKGLGPKTFKLNGDAIFEIIQDYLNRNKNAKSVSESTKLKKGATYQISYELYKSGKNVSQIAEERKLVETTIYGHIAHLIAEGKIDVLDFIDAKTLAEISELIKKNPDKNLSELRSISGAAYEFAELKMIQGFLSKEEMKS